MNHAVPPHITIRAMRRDDANVVSRVIIRAVRETNANDYSADRIDEIVASFTPELVAAKLAERDVLVACVERDVVGTAALGSERINSVFVSPDHQRVGIGAALMRAIERLARDAGRDVARLNASFTAVPFYLRLGYEARPNEAMRRDHGVVPMEKALLHDAAD